MNFRDHYDRAVKNGIDIGCAYVAQEVAESESFNHALDEEEFEYICSIIYDLVLKYNYSVQDLLVTVRVLNVEKNIPVLSITKSDLMETHCED